MRTKVSIIRCEDYTASRVTGAVERAVDLLGGMGGFIQPGQRVLLKPNLLSPHAPDDGVTTHPSVVAAVAALAVRAGGDCSIGDCPSTGGETRERYSRLLGITGMQEVAERLGVTPVYLNDSGTEVDVPGAQVLERVLLSDAVLSSDLVVSLPKFKTHGLMLFTGAVKNLYGCVPGGRKLEYHRHAGDDRETFARILVEILRAVRPGLSVMDGVVGMDGQGPASGRRRTFGVILASGDPVALDAAACKLAGVDPMQVAHLRFADEQGIGTADPDEIEMLGDDPADLSIPDFLLPHRSLASRMPRFLYTTIKNQVSINPDVQQDLCILCGACSKLCPVEAMEVTKRRLKIDYSKCIRCYCCQEVCPKEAIRLRPGMMYPIAGKLLRRRNRQAGATVSHEQGKS